MDCRVCGGNINDHYSMQSGRWDLAVVQITRSIYSFSFHLECFRVLAGAEWIPSWENEDGMKKE